jgi:hypothetical protein
MARHLRTVMGEEGSLTSSLYSEMASGNLAGAMAQMTDAMMEKVKEKIDYFPKMDRCEPNICIISTSTMAGSIAPCFGWGVIHIYI